MAARPGPGTATARLLCLLHHLTGSHGRAPPPTDACPFAAAGSEDEEGTLRLLEELRQERPDNIAVQSFDRAYYDSLSPE